MTWHGMQGMHACGKADVTRCAHAVRLMCLCTPPRLAPHCMQCHGGVRHGPSRNLPSPLPPLGRLHTHLKSGMPHEVEMPAPVKMKTRLALATCASRQQEHNRPKGTGRGRRQPSGIIICPSESSFPARSARSSGTNAPMLLASGTSP